MCFPCCYMLSKGISFWRFDDDIFLDSLFMDKKAFLQELIWNPCIFWFHAEIFEIFFFSCQLCFGLKTEIFISILVTQSHTLPPSVRRRSSTCLNFAPFWGSLRESTCRYPTLPTAPLEKVVKQSIIQVGIQYRLAKLLRKLPALLLYSFLVLGNGKSFIFKLFS